MLFFFLLFCFWVLLFSQKKQAKLALVLRISLFFSSAVAHRHPRAFHKPHAHTTHTPLTPTLKQTFLACQVCFANRFCWVLNHHLGFSHFLHGFFLVFGLGIGHGAHAPTSNAKIENRKSSRHHHHKKKLGAEGITHKKKSKSEKWVSKGSEHPVVVVVFEKSSSDPKQNNSKKTIGI